MTKTDAVQFQRLGVMLDCSRNAVMNIPSLKKWIDALSDLGYNTLMLYTEDTFEVENQPYFGYLRGRYSMDELKEIDTYAYERGVELIPAIQTLAHLNAIFRWPVYYEINDCNDILLTGEEKTYALIEDMFATLEKTVRTRTINIGMDEAHMLGRGKYQDIHGFEDRFDILLDHLKKVAQIAEKHGFRCIMWGDMFFRLLGSNYGTNDDIQVPEHVKEMIPSNVDLIYWDYYSTDKNNFTCRIKAHSAVKSGIWFAGGLWSWTGFAPHNSYSIDEVKAAFSACSEQGVENVFLTMWGDNGAECSKFALLPSLYYASEAAKGNFDMESIKKGFLEKYEIPFDAFMLTDLPGTANEGKDVIYNPEKYMLYNDCLLGVFDSTVREGDALSYSECAKKLKEYESHPDYGYIFKTLRTLCQALSLKFELGVRTRKAYDSKDKAALTALVGDYEQLLHAVEEFYSAFRAQWMKENKPNGFEVQDVRLGGLYFRVRHCMEILKDFLNGRTDSIAELEEPLLDLHCKKEFGKQPTCFNSWSLMVSTSVV